MDKENKTILPRDTKSLLRLLPELYPVDELKTLLRTSTPEEQQRYLGKLELIDELLDLIREEEEDMKLERVLGK